MRPNFLEPWGVQSAVPAGRGHTLDTASPLFDESQLQKYATDDPVAKL